MGVWLSHGPLWNHCYIFIAFGFVLFIINLGGKKDDNSSISEILKLNKVTMDWNIVDNLKVARHGHSITTLRKMDVEPYCVP